MSQLSIDQVKDLYYNHGLSAENVGQRLGFSVWQVIDFMKNHNLPRRKRSETNKIAYLKKQPSFNLKSTLTSKEKGLKIAGFMLYWGEGMKFGDHVIDLCNSDPLLIVIFLKFLRQIYGIDESRLRVLLYCYANQNTQDLIKYWTNITGIPKTQFTKPFIRQDYLEKKKNKMLHGLVHIRYCDKKLVNLIRKDTALLVKQFIGQDSEVDKRTSL